MIKYFNELDKKEHYQVYIIDKNNYEDRKLSLDFYRKYYKLFEYIKEINNFDELKLFRSTFVISNLFDKYSRQVEIINIIKDGRLVNANDLTFLLKDDRYEKIIKLLKNVDELGSRDLQNILSYYYYFVKAINKHRNVEVLNNFESALSELKEINNGTVKGKEINIIDLENYWYIMPSIHNFDERLYNTTGKNGHKEANLLYPYCEALAGTMMSPKIFFDKVKDIEANGVSLEDYVNYVGYGIDYLPNPLDKINDKSHLNNNILVTAGSVMAQGLLWEYFKNLNKESSNYKEALNKFKKVMLDDFLVRMLGFHKVIIRGDTRFISTSNLDYNDEFSEYIRNGWNIDFTNPLRDDYNHNQIKEDEGLIKLKQFHMD